MKTTNLEQSKKLKELGAPQDSTWWWVYCPKKSLGISDAEYESEDNWEHVLFHRRNNHLEETIPTYTLDELIEWLGDGFRSLDYMPISGNWQSSSIETTEYGATPLEAVYSLCIAVKEKP